MGDNFPQGTVHQANADLETAVRADPTLLELWAGLTPLGRNEFLCWVDDAKQQATRQRRIDRLTEDLRQGAPVAGPAASIARTNARAGGSKRC